MGEQTLVPIVNGTDNGAAHPYNEGTQPVNTESHRSEMQRPDNAQPTCLEIIRDSVNLEGFSNQVATRIAKDVRKSSRNIYESKWKTFCGWATENDILKPEKASVPELANFLNYLFVVRKLQVSTIVGYRAAISRVLRLADNRDLRNDPYLNALMTNFSNERPKNSKMYPSWDLAIVLKSLMKAPYEPLGSASLEHVTMKTLLLLLLASGCRRSEIHALSVKNVLFIEDKSVVLTPNPKFKAKNFNVKTGKGAFIGFKIESLDDFVGPDLREDASLCPVRCLKEYLERTKVKRKGISDLFITFSVKGLVKAAHPNTLSSWVKGVIAYDGNKGTLLKRATHEVRAQGASYALYENVAMENILMQCRWSQQTTFTSFYLREVSGQLEEVHALAPLMAAGSIIRKGRKERGRKKR